MLCLLAVNPRMASDNQYPIEPIDQEYRPSQFTAKLLMFLFDPVRWNQIMLIISIGATIPNTSTCNTLISLIRLPHDSQMAMIIWVLIWWHYHVTTILRVNKKINYQVRCCDDSMKLIAITDPWQEQFYPICYFPPFCHIWCHLQPATFHLCV